VKGHDTVKRWAIDCYTCDNYIGKVNWCSVFCDKTTENIYTCVASPIRCNCLIMNKVIDSLLSVCFNITGISETLRHLQLPTVVVDTRPHFIETSSGGASPSRQPGHFQVIKVVLQVIPSLSLPSPHSPSPSLFLPFFSLSLEVGPLKSS